MLKVGAATRIINNDLGTPIQGASVDQTVSRIRDDLEANAMLLRGDDEAVLLVSCDLGALLPEYVEGFRRTMAAAADLPERGVIITCTHTHTGPSVLPTSYFKEIDDAYHQRLDGWLGEVAAEAADSARPARIGWGSGRAKIGYNRRVCWSDGTHTMHRKRGADEFIGLEGPEDPEQIALFAVDEDDELIVIMHNNTAHPTTFYGRDFLSADYPGAAREYLRDVLGSLPVLFLNGAFGDIANTTQVLDKPRGETAEQRMERQAHLLAGETLRLLHEATFHEGVTLAHRYEDLQLDVRLPDPEQLAEAREVLARVDAGEEVAAWDVLRAHGRALLHDDFADDPVDTNPVHALRVGDLGIALQPTELFCRFGLDIKRRSPAPLTAVVSVADGHSSYCPTMSGIIGGGYSGEPLWWTRLEPAAGDRIVDSASRLLWAIWEGR
ncbi:MAG: hypothetical protein ACLFU7_00110 [Armatimonadota bacterium]